MKEIQLFKSQEFGEIRAIQKDGEPWFKLVDICNALGIGNPSDVVKRLNGKGVEIIEGGNINSLNQKANYINESNLYRVIISSTKPNAKRFENWIFEEVLPSIRKHGAYMTNETIEKALNDPDFIIQLATKLKEEKQKRIEAEKSRDKLIHAGKLYTSTELAKELNLKSAIELNKLLESKKIQYKQNNTWVLYTQYSGLNYVSIKQEVTESGKIIYDRKWTGKGRDFIIELLGGF